MKVLSSIGNTLNLREQEATKGEEVAAEQTDVNKPSTGLEPTVWSYSSQYGQMHELKHPDVPILHLDSSSGVFR